MADVDMPDAGPATPAKTKPNTKATKGGAADAANDSRKRFEVKKANRTPPFKPKQLWLIRNSGTLSRCGLGILW